MAEPTNVLARLQDEYLTCQICRTYYTKPKALPCLHTFCVACLQHYIRLNLSRHLPCPICRKKFRVSRKGVDAFPSNHLVNGIAELVRTQTQNRIVDYGGGIQGASAVGNTEHQPPALQQHRVILVRDNDNNLQSTGPSATATPSAQQRHQADRVLPITPVEVADCGTSSQLAQLALRDSPAAAAPGNSIAQAATSGRSLGERQSSTIACWVDAHIVRHDTNLLHKFGQYGAGLADFTNPLSVAAAPSGEIVVADMRENRVIVHDRTGAFRLSFQCPEEIRDVAVTSTGLVVVVAAYSETDLVVAYSIATGEQVSRIAKSSLYDMPHGVAVNARDQLVFTMLDSGDIYVVRDVHVADTTDACAVRKIDNTNHLIKTPFYVTTGSALNIIVSDSDNHSVHVFNAQGNRLQTFGAKDHRLPGDLKTPRGLCTDYKDNIIVADSGHQAVKLFSSKGVFVKTLVQLPSAEEAGFSLFPIDVAVRHFELFVLVVGPYFSQVWVYTYRPVLVTEDNTSTNSPSSICSLM